jgi:hypothetical protein
MEKIQRARVRAMTRMDPKAREARPDHGDSNGREKRIAGTFDTQMIGIIQVKTKRKTPRKTASG